MNINDIILKKDIKIIDNWISNISKKDQSNVIYIKGETGTGKTTLCKLIQERYSKQYSFYTFGTDYLKEKDVILNLVKHKDILGLFNQKSIIKGIIFDNIKTSSSFIKNLVKLKKVYFNYPIIITSNYEFNESSMNYKSYKITIKQKTPTQINKIYSDYKINKKILNSIAKKSNGDFNYINKTLYFIKLSPKITYNDINNLDKDVNLSNYFLLLRFINCKKICLLEYDYSFVVYIFNNLANILDLIKVDFKTKNKYISEIYRYSHFINTDYSDVFLLSIKNILNKENIKNIKYINTQSKLLLNNNLKMINNNIIKRADIECKIYLHNNIKKNKDGNLDKVQKFLNFEYY